jgi:uncharacterized membrane protein YphA (DoxX/SURF4 family)
LQQKGLLSGDEAESVARMNIAQRSEWIRANRDDDAANDARMIVKEKTIFDRYFNSLRADASDEREDVEAFKASRERFLETQNAVRNRTAFEQERRWNQLMGYRFEASYWTRKFDSMGNELQSDLGRLADLQLAGRRGQIITAPESELFPANPFVQMDASVIPVIHIPHLDIDMSVRSRMQMMDMAVMLALTAIGFCLIVGFCTRLACLGGAAFLMSVVLTTWPVPGVYPLIPSTIGNFMFVSKDLVELLALLVLALVPAGRWGGLDYFLWHYGGKQIAGLFCPCACSKESKNA